MARAITQILALLAAPMVLSAAIPMALDESLLVGAIALLLAVLPLVRALGPTWPRPRAALLAAGALALAAGFLTLTPPGRLLLASDLAGGAFTVALAAGLLAFSSLRP